MSGTAATGIDPAATEAWLRARVPDLAAPVTTELAAGGHSNLTFRITFIIELLMKHRFVLLYYNGYRDVLKTAEISALWGLE